MGFLIMVEKLDTLLETLKNHSSQERLDLMEEFSEFRKGYLEEQSKSN